VPVNALGGADADDREVAAGEFLDRVGVVDGRVVRDEVVFGEHLRLGGADDAEADDPDLHVSSGSSSRYVSDS
jgi:hypothetical protein